MVVAVFLWSISAASASLFFVSTSMLVSATLLVTLNLAVPSSLFFLSCRPQAEPRKIRYQYPTEKRQ